MDFIQGLNPQQQRAVTAPPGPILVMAGPGSGKTRVLTQRIAYLVGALGVKPYQILAVTFTNKAAREMEARVLNAVGPSAQGVTLGTFHAICARILRREAESLPFGANFVIFDSDDQLTLVKRALADLDLDDKRNRPHSIHAAISAAKNELILPADYPNTQYRDQIVRKVYERYQTLLLASNALDFDDLLVWTALLLEENPAVRERYARRYEHILVDEFQDTNQSQYTLLKHLASVHHNLFAVGDADQSIYRWRGADYRNVQRFEEDFPAARVILLEQNYRSTQAILDVAMAVIDRNPQRTRKQLFTERGAGGQVELVEPEDERVEAAFVVDAIALAVRAGAQPGEFAVMYRTNAQSRVLEEAFVHANLPYKLVGAQRFYGRREVKDLIAYLRLAHNPADEVSLGRVINTPTRAIGDKTFAALRTEAARLEIGPGELLLQLDTLQNTEPRLKPALGRGLNALLHFAGLLRGWVAFKEDKSPLDLLDRIIEDIDYRGYIADGTEEGEDRWENVLELRRLASENRDKRLEDFLADMALVSDQDTIESTQNVPTLLTLHAAKGLEYPVVFIVGLNDGILPHSRSLEDPEQMMEERRLLYVGVTRAKDRLLLLAPQSRIAYGGYGDATIASRFLDDIPEALLKRRGPTDGRSRRSRRDATEWDAEMSPTSGRAAPFQRHARLNAAPSAEENYRQPEKSSAPPRPAAVTRQFAAGMRVNHPAWGEGMVLNSVLQDQDEVVDIFFAELGMKRVVASLARLEILGGATP
jgi:DNA helicase-2/ATP-dependent DNA helicase PcrA